ncbi:DUF2846 domain-containing protein [Ferruginibacter sp. SUN106]|uniref:DUF2846 domain-containing protein n=1 Tax=Ferruginibacter sp. SUN106 TaxID=2978348 RepID=UPI003D36AFD8
MKNITILIIAVLCCFKVSAQTTGSYIYVYRTGQWGAALTNYAVFLDGKKICKLSNAKYIKIPVSPGTHELQAKKGGVDILKKETSLTVEVEAGKDNYVSCSIKSSITRQRMEMTEVVKSNGEKAIADMKPDNCQDDVEEKEK